MPQNDRPPLFSAPSRARAHDACTQVASGRAAVSADVDGLSLEALRAIWRERYGAPPVLRSPELLGLMLAWRIQLETEGGLDRDARLALRRPLGARAGLEPVSGARLMREWQGVPHEVVVLPDGGFLHRGERHTSLSQIARKITGVRWNGPRFFGLRSQKVSA